MFPYDVGERAEMFFEGKWEKGRIVAGYRFQDGIVTIETDDGRKIWCGEQRRDLYRPAGENMHEAEEFTGKWVMGCMCSVCHSQHGPRNAHEKPLFHYCPTCGTRMTAQAWEQRTASGEVVNTARVRRVFGIFRTVYAIETRMPEEEAYRIDDSMHSFDREDDAVDYLDNLDGWYRREE